MASRMSDKTFNTAVSLEWLVGTRTEVAEACPTLEDVRAVVVQQAAP